MTRKIKNITALIITILFILIGLLFTSTAFIPFELVKPKVDLLAVDGNLSFFTLKFYILLKHIGIFIILFGIFSKFILRKVFLLFKNLSKDAKIFFNKEVHYKLLSYFKAESKLHLIIFFGGIHLTSVHTTYSV